jgi:two-component system, cell cycle sensor histidine kinase and response regulator CckA
MPVHSNQADPGAQANHLGRDALIEAKITHLFFKQSPLGILGTLFNACALTVLLWGQVDTRLLSAWLGAILLICVLRVVVILRFYYSQPVGIREAPRWTRWNMIGLGATGLIWAAAMLVIFPVHSVVHQICTAFIVCVGVLGSAILYAGVSTAPKIFGSAPVIAVLCRFLFYADRIHWVVAVLEVLYLAFTFLASTSLARIRRRLLSAQVELADRVAERSKALEEANNALKSEIQERRKFEVRLRQERDRLEAITTTVGAGLAVISTKYRTLWVNRVFRETFGDVKGHVCFKAHYQRDRICDECGARMVFEHGYKKVIHEQRHADGQGNPIWFQIVTTPIRNAEGQIYAALELVLPITERKMAESARQRMAEKLEEARKTEAIATLAGGIAHQFNNALAVITGNIELMQHDYRHDPQIGVYASPISDAAGRMAQLTNQLLAYAQGGKYKERPNDLSAITETTLSLIKHTIAPEITVNASLEPDLPKVKIDVTQIQMVISAMVANAAEAIQGDGRITVTCSKVMIGNDNYPQHHGIPPGGYVVLSVTDNGAGMDDKTLKRVFEPFFTTKFQGRGLGMAAVYGIIRNHGGYIKVSSQAGLGSEVRIYLPALPSIAHPPKEKPGPELQGGGTVFVIEDDPGVVEINQAWLKRMGYDVLVATTAAQAIHIMCRTNTPMDVVLLDLVLPDMSGSALYPLIREHRPLAKVIVCSGYGLAGPTQELLDAGADGFIQKPYGLNDIHETIQKVISSGKDTGNLKNRSML